MPSAVEASQQVNELRSLHSLRSVGMTVLGGPSTHFFEYNRGQCPNNTAEPGAMSPGSLAYLAAALIILKRAFSPLP